MSTPGIVFATANAIVSNPQTGASVSVIHGGHWFADDPIVRAYPGYFTDDPRFGLASSRPLGDDGYPVDGTRKGPAVVEEATAAPGEKRTRGQARG